MTDHLIENPAVIDLGVMGYAQAWAYQQRVHQAVLDDAGGESILLVEHPPVITISQRKSSPNHLLANREQLAAMGIDVQPTNRGGDITYHGPGQLVAYPIVRLRPRALTVSGYMRRLEQAVIDTLANYDITGHRDAGATGVWVSRGSDASAGSAKICAMGVRLRRNITMHGLGLNVCPDLSHFQTIVPCGLVGRDVTSIEALIGDRGPTMATVKRDLTAALLQQLQASEPDDRDAAGG